MSSACAELTTTVVQMTLDGELHGHDSEIAALEFIPNHAILVSCDAGGMVFIWSVRGVPHPYAKLFSWNYAIDPTVARRMSLMGIDREGPTVLPLGETHRREKEKKRQQRRALRQRRKKGSGVTFMTQDPESEGSQPQPSALSSSTNTMRRPAFIAMTIVHADWKDDDSSDSSDSSDESDDDHDADAKDDSTPVVPPPVIPESRRKRSLTSAAAESIADALLNGTIVAPETPAPEVQAVPPSADEVPPPPLPKPTNRNLPAPHSSSRPASRRRSNLMSPYVICNAHPLLCRI